MEEGRVHARTLASAGYEGSWHIEVSRKAGDARSTGTLKDLDLLSVTVIPYNKSDPMHMAVLSAIGFFGASWCIYSLQKETITWLPRWLTALFLVVCLSWGLAMLLGMGLQSWKGNMPDGRPWVVAFLGFVLGSALVGIADAGKVVFFSVNASIFASLILALSAGWMQQPAATTQSADPSVAEVARPVPLWASEVDEPPDTTDIHGEPNWPSDGANHPASDATVRETP